MNNVYIYSFCILSKILFIIQLIYVCMCEVFLCLYCLHLFELLYFIYRPTDGIKYIFSRQIFYLSIIFGIDYAESFSDSIFYLFILHILRKFKKKKIQVINKIQDLILVLKCTQKKWLLIPSWIMNLKSCKMSPQRMFECFFFVRMTPRLVV